MGKPLKRPLVAVLLSLLYTGLGQAYNKQPGKAVLIAVIPPTVALGASWVGGLNTFARLAGVLTALIAFELLVAVDAWRIARREEQRSANRGSIWLAYGCLAGLLAAQLVVLGNAEYFSKIVRVRAFRIASASMSPTILKSDRAMADMRAYRGESPQRGDLVIVELEGRGLFARRVVALPGDVVSGTGEGILVNGHPLAEPHWREEIPWLSAPTLGSMLYFEPITIGPGELYVLGDNYLRGMEPGKPRTNLVRREQVQGKPLYIYWSEDLSRVGRTLQ